MPSKPMVDMSQESEHPRSMSSRSPELKFHQLQYLIAVAEHGSLRMAAGGVPPSGVRAEGVGFAVEALQGLHGGRDQEVIGELR